MAADPRSWLTDIADACAAVRQHTSGIDMEGFLRSHLVRSAVERELIAMGEAMTRLRDHGGALFRELTAGPRIIGMRDTLTHGCATVDPIIVWTVARDEVAELERTCMEQLARLNPPTEGAGGLVFDPAGRVLLIRRDNGEWMFPKGHIDPGEDALTTALREVEEEAGVIAACPDPEARWITRYVNDRGVPREVTWFRLAAPAGTTPTMREALFPEGAFLPVPEALARLTFEEDRRLLRAVAGEEGTA
jgi:diadenosine hexaphosphate hydrolase (ATP-forming)